MLKEGIPRHTQISEWLRSRIDESHYEADEKLPSENELCDKFDVSRVTVRRALQTLENEDLIYRCQGLGSFVTDHRSHHSFSTLNDFSEELAESGMKASSEVVSFTQKDIAGQHDILSSLEMQNKSLAVEIERIRLGDGQPIAFDSTWLPIFYGQLIEGYDLRHQTIFTILEEEFEIPIERGCYRIEAALANKKLATHLQINIHAPVLLITRISYTVGNKPVYYQQRYYRNDKMVFEMMADRTSASSSTQKENNITLKEFTPVFKEEK
ncbi:transcriptional regulator, GntR family [Fodinibius roseus]|uniref:Transcriptional regulator, GntR family n=1 Tax=Fodinibius roseus TaxID=1194090 RepID=A0A1M4UYT3_9BACT|nr:GntR family transcriptional regulator [Fodinibius roseus]SHE61818.1 transcriptional regulator, GntR family [Fodinibius roseus]